MLYNPDDRCTLHIASLEFRAFAQILCRQNARENHHIEEDDTIGETFVLLQPFVESRYVLLSMVVCSGREYLRSVGMRQKKCTFYTYKISISQVSKRTLVQTGLCSRFVSRTSSSRTVLLPE